VPVELGSFQKKFMGVRQIPQMVGMTQEHGFENPGRYCCPSDHHGGGHLN
jgi:hypothetical protein